MNNVIQNGEHLYEWGERTERDEGDVGTVSMTDPSVTQIVVITDKRWNPQIGWYEYSAQGIGNHGSATVAKGGEVTGSTAAIDPFVYIANDDGQISTELLDVDDINDSKVTFTGTITDAVGVFSGRLTTAAVTAIGGEDGTEISVSDTEKQAHNVAIALYTVGLEATSPHNVTASSVTNTDYVVWDDYTYKPGWPDSIRRVFRVRFYDSPSTLLETITTEYDGSIDGVLASSIDGTFWVTQSAVASATTGGTVTLTPDTDPAEITLHGELLPTDSPTYGTQSLASKGDTWTPARGVYMITNNRGTLEIQIYTGSTWITSLGYFDGALFCDGSTVRVRADTASTTVYYRKF
jgi:hypothetical protein